MDQDRGELKGIRQNTNKVAVEISPTTIYWPSSMLAIKYVERIENAWISMNDNIDVEQSVCW